MVIAGFCAADLGVEGVGSGFLELDGGSFGVGIFQGFWGTSLAFCCAARISCCCCCCIFFRSFCDILGVKLPPFSRRAFGMPRLMLETRVSEVSLMISCRFFFESDTADEAQGTCTWPGETEPLVFL